MNLSSFYSQLLLAPGSVWNLTSGEDLLWLIVLMLMAAAVGLMLAVTLYLAYILRRTLEPESAKQPATYRPTRWQRFTGLQPLSRENDLVMEHAYDGIQELDNPTPPWFMSLFYGTIAIGIVYLVVYHVIDAGPLQLEEYTDEVAVAEVERAAYIKKVAGSINENTVKLVTDASSLESGKTLFGQYCTACHGQQGQGGVGPNLTDAYWMHGGTVKAVFRTITDGVPEKGMIAWKKQLNPLQVQQLASYILSLQGTKPAGAKEPQGQKEGAANVAMR